MRYPEIYAGPEGPPPAFAEGTHILAGGLLGFVGDEGEEGARRAYPAATPKRLAEVKRRYDPDNLFRLNVNVPPDGI
ncbi:MAG TPA: BBE domain-containing protein [Gaiellales bacterium]|jgi:FAD/FMN-containing dehydrogenase